MGKVIQNALLAPQRALQEDQGGRYLLVVNSANVIEKRYVQLGQTVGSLQEITSGIDRNDRIVVGELWRASPGLTVAPKLTTAE
jgi:multidrug efflux pump subunit AcrA (membrane-fusion protein)